MRFGVWLGAMALLLAGFSPSLPAQTPSAAAMAKRVDAHYNHLHSLEARYSERYEGMGMDRTETGTLTLRKPGRMRWAYDSPPGKLFLLDGKNAISYTPGDAEATRFPESKLDDLRTPLRFLLGHTELAKELDGLTLTLVKGGYTLSGAPKGVGQGVQSMALTVDPQGVIHVLRIEETDGAVTTFTFSGIHENVATDTAEFRFTPPPGVTVIDGAAPI